MKPQIVLNFEDEVEFHLYNEAQADLAEESRKYNDLYQWARSLWKHSDKESISIQDLETAFIRL